MAALVDSECSADTVAWEAMAAWAAMAWAWDMAALVDSECSADTVAWEAMAAWAAMAWAWDMAALVDMAWADVVVDVDSANNRRSVLRQYFHHFFVFLPQLID
ncbi:hypothetical protein TELCIR_04460 [Teladorsagia circumcincta]|uniref:Uncharacterized protein n=1 Tax=Teladorsagia circumcincta TaxID=45464 RepID=A0A2G9UTK8_TELCI|nr:hypothetical protein TELCIR_04460 [Teladorsagia circumcincta]